MSEDLERLQRRLDRERLGRREAESIAERVTSDFYATAQLLERTNLELSRTNDELQEVNQQMRDFVAIASHDLRGPLTSILGFADTLIRRADKLSDKQRADCLETIKRQGQHLARLVEDLLTVSRIEAGALDVHRDVVGLHDALGEAIEDFTQHAAEIQVVVPDDLTALVDPDHLRRILVNFVGNALKYGSPPVEVVASDAGDWIEIRVRDQGHGVPEEFRPRLFSRFARSDEAVAGGKGGTGLGLSIVQGLAQANGGDVWYEPNTPCGSCFAVRLPRNAA
jgi:signal transduction histidine kinase